jgi:hypothetical protein
MVEEMTYGTAPRRKDRVDRGMARRVCVAGGPGGGFSVPAEVVAGRGGIVSVRAGRGCHLVLCALAAPGYGLLETPPAGVCGIFRGGGMGGLGIRRVEGGRG